MPDNKILIKNIYWMLCYAFNVWKHPIIDVINAEEFDDIDNLFAAVLSKGVAQQLKQGLYREYLGHRDDIATVRGKIDVNGSIQHKINHKQLLCCEYDDLSENNLNNQIIKTTMYILTRSNKVEKKYKDVLRKEMLSFSDVNFIEPKTILWSRVSINRNNGFYSLLMGICRLVLDESIMSPEPGNKKLLAFDEDSILYNIYETFVREYFRREFPKLNVSRPNIDWALDEATNTSLLPQMKTDTTLKQGDRVLIVDTKFYKNILTRHEKLEIRSSHLYQIFAYVKNMAAKPEYDSYTISGMLLYARTDEDMYPDESYKMSGNRVDVRTLDLNRDFAEIKSDLNGIVEEFFNLDKTAADSL